MKRLKLTLLLAAFALATSFGYAQTTDTATITPKHDVNVFVGENLNSGKQTKESILEHPYLSAKDPNNEIQWDVVSYLVVFVVNGREEAPISITGARFSEKVIAKIQSAQSGTIIEFADIRIQSVAGTRTIVRPIVVRIQ